MPEDCQDKFSVGFKQRSGVILRHNLNHESALLALGHVCKLKGPFRDAVLALNRLIVLNPELACARERLGELYYLQRLESEAAKCYLAAAQMTRESIRLYQTALGIEPSNHPAARALSDLGAERMGIRPG